MAVAAVQLVAIARQSGSVAAVRLVAVARQAVAVALRLVESGSSNWSGNASARCITISKDREPHVAY